MSSEVILTGWITADPELILTPQGEHKCTFDVAVWRSRDGGKIDFVEIMAWGELADFVSKHYKKGKVIDLSGKIRQRKWIDEDGVRRYKTFVRLEYIYICNNNLPD